jgi:hypothetical protein
VTTNLFIIDIEAMTHDQIETRLRSSAKALVADPTDVEASAMFSLLNDHAIRRWITSAARKGNRGEPQKENPKRSEANGYAASLPALEHWHRPAMRT